MIFGIVDKMLLQEKSRATMWRLRQLASAATGLVGRVLLQLEGVECGRGVRISGVPVVINNGSIVFGAGVTINSGTLSNPVGGSGRTVITVLKGATLKIGKESGISNSEIYARERISIGERVMIGGGCKIFDTDFHPVEPGLRRDPRQRPASAPVVIGDDVFVGAFSMILKGVTIGKGSVVGAGSVVTKDIPEAEVWAGVPARRLYGIRSSGIE